MKRFVGLTALVLTVCLFVLPVLPASAACSEHVFDAGTMVLEPTCDTIGIMVYTCNVCGYQAEEKIGNLGHDLRSGECTRCGLREDGTHAEVGRSEAAEASEASDVEEVTLLHVTPVAAPAPAEKLPAITAPAAAEESANRAGRVVMMLFGAAMILMLPKTVSHSGKKRSAKRRR